jgi:Family of unknown function (DUF5677)
MGETQEQYEERRQKFARAALPRLGVVADELEALTIEVFQPRISYTRDDGASLMVLSFATKQYEHLRSVRVLIDAGCHRDALLIARTMVEGLGRLRWAFAKRPERTELWLWHGAILDWRQTLENEKAGMVIDPDEKAGLKALVDQHGPAYFTDFVRKGIAAAEKGGPAFKMPRDPWRTKWTDTSFETMCSESEVALEHVYETTYRRSSEWSHWGPRAIAGALEHAEWGVAGFTEEDWPDAGLALTLGCFSLLQSLAVLDAHFSLGHHNRLAGLARKLHAIDTESGVDAS